MICKVCDHDMGTSVICRNCEQYHLIARHNVKLFAEFLVIGRIELRWWRNDKIARIFIRFRRVKEFTMPELTPELAKEWIEKLKSYNLMS